MKKAKQDFLNMTLDELRQATKEFDKPQHPRGFRPLNAEEQTEWNRMRKGPWMSVRLRGRPRIGGGTGAVVVPVSLERELLDAVDRYAKRLGLKRSPVVAMALRRLMEETPTRAAEGVKKKPRTRKRNPA